MEEGWQKRGKLGAVADARVWKFLGSCGLKVLKARKTKGTDADSAAKTAAAEFIRDGLFASARPSSSLSR